MNIAILAILTTLVLPYVRAEQQFIITNEIAYKTYHIQGAAEKVPRLTNTAISQMYNAVLFCKIIYRYSVDLSACILQTFNILICV